MENYEIKAWDGERFRENFVIDGSGDMYTFNKTFDDKFTFVQWDQYQWIGNEEGERLYEGDVVKVRDSLDRKTFVGVVEFENSSFMLRSETTTRYRWADYEIIEILGNICENEDLLKTHNLR